jgi:hypothetical protein
LPDRQTINKQPINASPFSSGSTASQQLPADPLGQARQTSSAAHPILHSVVAQRPIETPSQQAPTPPAYFHSPQQAQATTPQAAPAAPPQRAPQPPVFHPPPNWPGLGIVETPQESTSAYPFKNVQLKPHSTTINTTNSEEEMNQPAAPRKQPLWPMFVLGMFVLALCWLGWNAFKSSASLKKIMETATGNADPMASETRKALPTTSSSKPDIIPKTIRDRYTALDTGAAAADIVRKLVEAKTTEDRLKALYNPDENREDVDRLFKSLPGPLKPISMEAGVLITDLVSAQEVPIFKVVTEDFRVGAILRMIPDEKKTLLIDWPLFSQSYDLSFDHYISNSELPDGTALWFTLMFKRTHDFVLQEPQKHAYDCFLMQGSFSPKGNALVYVHKDSAIGRLLASRTNWNNTYIAKVLVGKTTLGTQRVHVILDAETGPGDEKK